MVDGHVWLTITSGDKTEAYGLWPASHPRFRQETSPPTTDVRRGIGNSIQATASRYYELTPDQLMAFEAATREKVAWGYTTTCASWASDTVHRITGERVDASEYGGLTDIPRKIRESIDQLEGQHSTSREAPLVPQKPTEPAVERGNSSSSGLFSVSDASDRQIQHLLDAAGDSEHLRFAMEALRASAPGQAFMADAGMHAVALTSAEQTNGMSESTQSDLVRGQA